MSYPDPKIPEGPLEEKWTQYKQNANLISPANRSKYTILVLGTGLAGSSAAASLAEMGYRVKCFTFHDSARRAHSVAAQGGINAAKNYQNDGDSVHRMFYDTLKGGDFRSREANVYRLAECSEVLIDQAVAQGVPFAREYGGYFRNRSFGGVQVSRTFYARGQTGQQLLYGAFQALLRQVHLQKAELYTRHEMVDLVVEEGRAKGLIIRNLDTGKLDCHEGHAVVLASGGFGKIYYLSTLAMACNGSAIWRAHKKGAYTACPSWTQFHPTSLPQSGAYQSKLTLMSESLRNDGRIWVPKKAGDQRPPNSIPEEERDYYLERKYPAYGNLAPRDIASRAAKQLIDAGHGVGKMKNAVYLDFEDAIQRKGKSLIEEKYGNLFSMYKKITGIDAYQEPMMISPAAHFSMGGLWVDYELSSNLPGLYVIGEANFSDHGANRLGANSLLQACVDGYFILPYTLPNYLKTLDPEMGLKREQVNEHLKLAQNKLEQLIKVQGNQPVDYFHKQLGTLLYDYCGLSRNEKGLKKAINAIKELRAEFWKDVRIPGSCHEMNDELEKAGRVADYLEIAEQMCYDALSREESCGAHFREEYQTQGQEALRNDEDFSFVSLWNYNKGDFQLIREPLVFEREKPKIRSY